MIKNLSGKIIELGGTPKKENTDQKILIKELSKQLEEIEVKSILKDEAKNIICDVNLNKIKVRFQRVIDIPSKKLRQLVDQGKKDLGEGIVIIFSSKDKKVGLAVGVTESLTNKYDAVKFVKLGSEIIGGKGGGGRPDFAQAGGLDENKINEAFAQLKFLV